MTAAEELFERWGRNVTLYPTASAAGVSTMAFIQPILTGTGEKGAVRTALGINDDTRFRYIGPSEPVISPNSGWLAIGTEKYDFLSAELVYIGGEVSHCEGILRRRCDI